MDNTTSKKSFWAWLVAVVVLALLVFLWLSRSKEAGAPFGDESLSSDDTTAALERELQATDLGDLEKELQSTEADLNSL